MLNKFNIFEKKFKNNLFLRNIDIYAQPIVSNTSSINNNFHFEILTRFYDKNNNLINSEFLFNNFRFKEDFFNLDKLIFKKTFDIISKFPEKNLENSLFGINLTEESIENFNDFYIYLDSLFKIYTKLKPKNFNLEFTERKSKNIELFIEKSLDYGFSLSADDFGSQDLTFGKLQNNIIPIFKKRNLMNKLFLKLDKSIIINLNKNYYGKKIDLAYLDFFLTIKDVYKDINIVLEGIENKEIYSIVFNISKKRNTQIDYFQGYYFGKPKKLDLNYVQPILKDF